MSHWPSLNDHDDAYANGPHVAGSELFPEQWQIAATEFRSQLLAEKRASLDLQYGPEARSTLDWFRARANEHGQSAATKPAGIVLFIHGGYWMKFDKSYWSHFANGCLDNGWDVCLPSYSLAPDARIANISQQIAVAIEYIAANSSSDCPLSICGHSAGGHLAARMLCQDMELSDPARSRIVRAVSISGVHDLRPLLYTSMNQILNIDSTEAIKESPALLQPVEGSKLYCYVGKDERPEFVRQSELMANVWHGLKVETELNIEEDRHHFNIIDALQQRDSWLVKLLTST